MPTSPHKDLASVPSGMPSASGRQASTDVELLRRYLEESDQDAFATLVNRYSTAVYTLCRRQLRDPAGADDAAQATFLVLERRASTLVRREASVPLAPWLMRTAGLVCANQTRDRRRRQRHEHAAGSLTKSATTNDDRDLGASVDIAEMIARLPRSYREVVTMRYLMGRTCQEIAVDLGLEIDAVNKRLSRGLALLRTRMGSSCEATLAMLFLGPANPPPTFSALPPSPRAAELAEQSTGRALAGMGAVAAGIALAGIGVLALAGLPTTPISDERTVVSDATPTPEQHVSPAGPYGLRAGESKLIDSFCVWEMAAPEYPSPKPPLMSRIVEYALIRLDVDAVTSESARVSYTQLVVSHWKPRQHNKQQEIPITTRDGINRVVSFHGNDALILFVPPEPRSSVIGPGPHLSADGSAIHWVGVAPGSYEDAMAGLGLPVWLPPPVNRSEAGTTDEVSLLVSHRKVAGTSLTIPNGVRYTFPAVQVLNFTASRLSLDLPLLDANG
jgi:RNA polymerase sigma factor (sigma-70 family)